MSRLLIIDPGLDLWGSERALLSTVPDLVDAHETVVAVVPYGAALGPELIARGVTVYERHIDRLGQRNIAMRGLVVAELIALCLRCRIDVIYLNQGGLCRVAGLVARILGKRLVVHVRIAEDLGRVARLTATARSPVDAILISRDMADRFRRLGSERPHFRVYVAYDVFEEDTAASEQARPDDAFVCLGRIVAIKGQLELAKAFALLDRRGVTARLDFMGAASQEPEYGKRVHDAVTMAALEDRVTFHGYVEGADRRLPSYAFVVVPSRYEPLGRIVFEAWHAGCVPICSMDSGGAAEIISLSGGGLTYVGFEPASLADAMERALTLTNKEREEFVRRGRLWMTENTAKNAYRTALSGSLFPDDTPATSHASQICGLCS